MPQVAPYLQSKLVSTEYVSRRPQFCVLLGPKAPLLVFYIFTLRKWYNIAQAEAAAYNGLWTIWMDTVFIIKTMILCFSPSTLTMSLIITCIINFFQLRVHNCNLFLIAFHYIIRELL